MKTIAILLAAATTSHAAIIYSGLKDFTITSDPNGIYVDVDAGTTVGVEAPGWDFVAFFGSEAIANSPAFQPVRTTSALYAPVVNLAPGTTVGASSIFGSGFNGSGEPVSHIGVSANQFVAGIEGYLGFKLTTNASAGPYYGYMRVILTNNGSNGLIRDWSYDDSGAPITISAVPEISYSTLPLVCAGSLALRRRRIS